MFEIYLGSFRISEWCAQLCLTLWGPMDRSPSGSSANGIFQARILEWGSTSYLVSNGNMNIYWASLVAQMEKNLPAMQDTQI